MRRVNFYVTTALSICLFSVPALASETGNVATGSAATANAPSANAATTDTASAEDGVAEEATAEEIAMFVPLVQPCIAEPEGDACASVRALVRSCAAEMKPERCKVIFDEGNVVFDDPALVARMQAVLQHVEEAMPEFASPKPDDLDEDVLEGERIDAETELLLGDENQMTHSSPPVMNGDADEELQEELEELEAETSEEEVIAP